MKRKWTVLWIAALLMLSLGCALLGGQATEEPQPPADPGDVRVGQEQDAPVAPSAGDEDVADADEDEDEDELLTFDADALDGLNSYRMNMIWTFTGDDGSAETFNIQEEATRNPAAQRYIMESGGESIEFIQIEQTQWMRFGEEWMQTTMSDDEAMSGFGDFFIQPDEMFADMGTDSYKYVGKETVNGMNTRHYQVEDNVWQMAQEFNASEIETGIIDVWVADEKDLPKFMVRYEVIVTGKFEEEGSGKLALSWNIYDVNTPITIEAPADAGGLPADLELCQNASDVMTMGSMAIFTCPDTVENTITFYTDMLEDAGWEAGEVTNLETMLMGTWTKDGESLSLTITEDEESGGSSVMLTLGE